jgi:hypothetical protein
LCVFWSIWKPSECKMKQNLYFKQECTILGYGSCENHFPPNAFILIPHTNNGVCKCFGAFWKPSKCKMKQNLCFGAECTISGYRSCEYYFPPNASILIHHTNKCVCECFGSFGNLWNVNSSKTSVSSLNALFWGTEVAKIISHQMHPF